jgi:transposase
MSEVTTIGLDIAKSVFHAHGADEHGQTVFSRKIARTKLLGFSRNCPRAWLRWRHAAARIIGHVS